MQMRFSLCFTKRARLAIIETSKRADLYVWVGASFDKAASPRRAQVEPDNWGGVLFSPRTGLCYFATVLTIGDSPNTSAFEL